VSRPLDLDVFDDRAAELDIWIERAAEALGTFYLPKHGGFRRSTLSGDDDTSATSTYRAFFALVEVRRVFTERGETDACERVDEQLRGVLDHWVLPLVDPEKMNQLRGRSDNEANDFTDAHLLIAAALAPAVVPILTKASPNATLSQIGTTTSELANALGNRLKSAGGGSITPGDAAIVHDFVTLHCVRGIDAHRAAFPGTGRGKPSANPPADTLAAAAQSRLLAQLAYRSADVFARFDPAELLFSAALLSRFEAADWQQLVRQAVRVVCLAQSDDGAWPSSRIVAYEARRLLHVASIEVALTLANMTYRNIVDADRSIPAVAFDTLDKTMLLVRAGYVARGTHHGWANDRTQWEGLIESWATAIVLTFLIRYREVLLAIRQHEVLHRYRAQLARHADAPEWRELDWMLRLPGEVDLRQLKPPKYFDPSGEPMVKALLDRVIQPVADDPVQRPADSGRALILYGKPGTRKTSLVKCMSRSLRWPMVTLSPPNFLSDGGLDGFEAAADRIFRDLMRLRRCVVLFDECEDFFKPRPRPRDRVADADNEANPERPESRTIGAFLTAGMLPRLQALRDNRWVIFVLATNSGLRDLDDAVIRLGRFDFAQEIDHPVLEAQCAYVDGHFTLKATPQREILKTALRKLDKETKDADNETKDADKGIAQDADMPFAVIDSLARDIVEGRLKPTEAALSKELRKRREALGPPPLL
jgi:hypothetical protein